MTVLYSSKSKPLHGRIQVPGDKSISHRALILSALAIGESQIHGLLESTDVIKTTVALDKMGVNVGCQNNIWKISGCGSGGLSEPNDVLNFGNSGTGARLFLGLAASHDIRVIITGDLSLRQRPMDRIIFPIGQMGAQFVSRGGNKLPITVNGTGNPVPITYKLPVPSSQVKSAILIAGLQAPGKTTVIEPQATRDHTERMMRCFGVSLSVEKNQKGKEISVVGQTELKPFDISVPGDFSSAAFFIVAGLLVPDSDLTLTNVGINPLRIGLLDTLAEMGANIQIKNKRDECNEPVADIRVRSSLLQATDVPATRSPSMIDEYPILGIAAALASGRTVLRGLNELRLKESNRLKSTAAMLRACGTNVTEDSDSLVISGTGNPIPGGGRVITENDHRIAMSALVAGMVSRAPVRIDSDNMIDTSFPKFAQLANSCGASISKRCS